MGSFQLDSFIEECRAAVAESNAPKAVREVVARAVSDPAAVIEALGEPESGCVQKLYVSDEVTVLNLIWAPKMVLQPHDHRMWAVIGIYSGREDNVFWKRVPGSPEGQIEAAAARALQDRDAVILGPEIIHSVTNPIPRLTGAIHVYGGDFVNSPRSNWDPETLHEHPYNFKKLVQQFDEDNRRWFAAR